MVNNLIFQTIFTYSDMKKIILDYVPLEFLNLWTLAHKYLQS